MDGWPKTIYSSGTFILAAQIMWNIRYTYRMMINIPSLETHRVVVVVVLVQLCCLTTFLQSTNVKTVSVNIWEPPSPPFPMYRNKRTGTTGCLKGTLLLLFLQCKIFADTRKHVIYSETCYLSMRFLRGNPKY
jgi:hypothetical protein